jgi:hypothetical protein
LAAGNPATRSTSIMTLTRGRGVDVAIEALGTQPTFEASQETASGVNRTFSRYWADMFRSGMAVRCQSALEPIERERAPNGRPAPHRCRA